MRIFLSTFFTILTICSCTKREAPFKQPNIVLILTDDQGWGDLSYHGNTNLSTPNIDSIAYKGMVLENFFVQPVCSPTRAELLTGQHFPRLGVYATSAGGERMDFDVPTIADVLKSNGYQTAAYGKWHNGMQPPYHPNARGFDDFYGFCSGHWGNYFSPMLERNGEIVKGNGFLVDDLFNYGIDFVSENRDKPFFLYLPINTPHSPMQSPDEYWARFKDKPLTMQYQGDGMEDERFTRAALAMVENIDWNIGRLNAILKKNDLEENTIVIFMSDNGPNGWRWNGGMRGKKGSTDEGGVKSPFFIKWPKHIKAGHKSKQLTASIDLLPILTGLAKIKLPDTLRMDGLDLSSKVLNQNPATTARVVYNHWNGETSLRTQKYRLDAENRLYDMDNDLGQTIDISSKKPIIKDSLVRIKEKWEQEILASKIDKKRPFTIGTRDYDYTQLPARDAIATGSITRSNRWPNDSFYTNWVSTNDSIFWNVDILEEGTFEVFLYYTCKKDAVGTELQLAFNNSKITKVISEFHDPDLIGADKDRSPRMESYVKDFKAIKLGEISLNKGIGQLSLSAITMPGNSVIDFRLLNLKRK